MFRKHNSQEKLFDSTTNVCDRKKSKIHKSWADPFRHDILPTLRSQEESFRDFYHATTGRPNHEISVMLGTIILKHQFDLTDESTVENFTFNTLWHYALDLDASGLKPGELFADTHYGSQENVDDVLDKGVELIAPACGTNKSKEGINFDDFEFSEDGQKLIKCPNDQVPQTQRFRRNREYGTADFDLEKQCSGCPFYDCCVGKVLKSGKRRVRWNQKTGKLSHRRSYELTKEFKDKYKTRSGIEATFSQLKNTHGGNALTVRGFHRC